MKLVCVNSLFDSRLEQLLEYSVQFYKGPSNENSKMLVRDIFFQLQLSLALVDEKVLTLALGYIMFWTITPGHIKAGAIVGFGFLCNFDLIIHFEPLHLPGHEHCPGKSTAFGQF